MKIAYNPKTAAALTTAPANDDITFDLSGLSIYVKGIRFKGIDTTYSVFKKHGSSGGGYDGLVPVPNYNNDSKNRYLREDGTWQYIEVTDQNVLQSETTATQFRPIVLGLTCDTSVSNLAKSVTGQVHVTTKMYAQPSTGYLYASKLFSGGKEVLTEHQSLSNYVTLNTNQTITGVKTFSVQQKFTVGEGTSPFTVTSTTKVANLNADLLDGYHASSLWRSDGATWNPSANISLSASANNQEWSFDIRRNGYTGCYWHVWDSTIGSMLKVNADNGKVYAPHNFVGNLEGNAATASKLGTSTVGATNVPIYLNGGTPTVVNLNSTANNLINSLSTGTSTPQDNDYYVCQYAGGGTTTTTYHRRPISALYSYIKNKAEGTWKINVTGNAATATKLQTARTLWGQSFDGTANVSGSLIQVTDITMGGHINMTNSQPSIKRNNENIIRIADAGLIITPYATDGFIALRCGTKTDTSGTKELRILNNGNIGIGITSPSQKLHVSGNILATGIMTAAHFYESSDILLKENISSILGTDNIPILRKFNWKKDGKVGYGFIAQELEEQGYYELVNGNEDGTKTVHYTAALSLVVAKLQNKIKELEKEIENLKIKS